jgi:hypothetical protein
MFEILFDGALKERCTSSILPLRPISKHILRYFNNTFLKMQNLVLVVVCSLLGNSPASEFYMPTFRYSFIFIGKKVNNDYI